MKRKKRLLSVLRTVLFYAAILGLWQLISWLGTDIFCWWKPYLVTSPIEVAKTLFRLSAKNGTLWTAIGISMKRLLFGYALSLASGLLLALLMINSRGFYKDMKALLSGIQTLPNVCWLPFAIIYFGLGEDSIIFVIVMGSTFSIATSIDSALREINPIYIKAAKTMCCPKLMTFAEVVFPAALPQILAGLKHGWAFAWRALIAGEVLSASLGLGQLLVYGRELFDISQVFGIMLVIIAFGIIFEKLIFGIAEDAMLRKRGIIK